MGEKKKFLVGFLTGIVLMAVVCMVGYVGVTELGWGQEGKEGTLLSSCLLYTSPSPRDRG